ncbi:MAG: TonB-dependent receptor plug [Mucilaginibacter sp.]|nr:TonB-dependent receptor plug [Mucilaginibacter sp.]
MYKNYTISLSGRQRRIPKILLIMKLTTVILIITFAQVSAHSVAQSISINKKHASLQTIFKEIGRQSGYDFFYDAELLNGSAPVDINVKNADLHAVLEKCLAAQPFSYAIEGQTVIIKKKDESIFSKLRNAFSAHVIKGTVNDENGEPLPGATISVKNSNEVTVSDNQGNFSISIPTDNAVLIVSFVGYGTREVPVNSSSENVIVKLSLNVSKLDAVVITDSYGSQIKKAYTGAANTVSADALSDKPFTSPLQALQGQVAGLNVTSSSGQPGSNIQIRLRGLGSIGLDSNPLYVVDGLIINAGDMSRLSAGYTNVLAGLNEDDIETITVLKDASAAAIYGSRGANGVVIITTKRGKTGGAIVNFDTEIGASSNIPLPKLGRPLSAADYSNLTVEGLTNEGISPTNTTSGIPFYINSYGLFKPGTDWYDLVTRNGQQRQYNVSVSGGNQNTKVFASAGYFKQEAGIIGSSFNRASGTLNVDQVVGKRFKVSLSVNGSNVNQNIPLEGNTSLGSPVNALYDLRPTQNAYNPDGTVNSSIAGNTNFPTFYNPLYTVAHDKKQNDQTRLLGQLTLKYNIWDNLFYTGTAGMDYNVLEETQYYNPVMSDYTSVNGSGVNYYSRYANWTLRNQLDYKYNIPHVDNFYVDAAIGYEAQKSNGYFISAQSNNYPSLQPLLTASANASTAILGNSSFSDYSFNSFYARGSVNYQSKYILTGSFRRDGSSRFGLSNQYGNFWSLGGAWNVDEEDFFTRQHVVSSAKIRASYGILGNAGNGPNSSLSNYSAQPTAAYGANYAGATGQNFTVIGNTLITWESSKDLDVGADIGFLKDRLVISFDYYNRDIDGLIQSAPISRTTGFSTAIQNIGDMRNRGEEFSITGIPVKTRDFKWTTSFNIAFNKNTVTKLANGAAYYNLIDFHVKEGADFYTWSMPQYAGVDPANGEALWYTDGSKTKTTNAYSLANLRVDKYQADPKYFGGWNNTFNYKGFQLAADIYYSGGNYVYDSAAATLNDGTQYTYNKYQYDLGRWTTPGQITDVPKYVAGGGTLPDGATLSNSSSLSTRFLYKGDYIRLRNVSAGYNFSNIASLKKYGINKLYLYGRATNLFTKTFDGRLPFDPEVGVNGVRVLDIPQVRTFTIGLNVSF